jgi:hypothetical protein
MIVIGSSKRNKRKLGKVEQRRRGEEKTERMGADR